MPRKRTNIPANETPEQRFVRVANERVNRLLTGLKQLGTLGNPSQYKSKTEQRSQIGDALKASLERAMDSMNKGGEVTPEFKLK